MFLVFRSRKQAFRIVLAIIVAPVIITMVITLIPGIGGTSSGAASDAVVAEVGDEQITVREAQYRIQDFIRVQRVPPQAYGFLAPTVVQNLINERLLLREAERLGLRVTEAELAETMRKRYPVLFPGGNFIGTEQYAAFLRSQIQKSVPEFEAEERNNLTLAKLRGLVTDGVIVAPQEIEREYARRNEKVKIDYAQITAASVQGSISSTQAEVEEHFKQNRAAYTMQERRSFRYLVIDDSRVAASVQVKPEELQRYYNENQDRYRIQERSRVTHILFKTTEKKPDEITKIEAKAQDVLKQVRAGKDFAALAKQHSEDTVSAEKGGEVGWITRGQTVPEFEQKAFSMKPGEISDLVKTQYGFHILKLLERENARLKPFAEVETSIREEILKDRVELERSRLTDRARAAAVKFAQNLEEAGKALGLPVLTATSLERASPIPGVGVEPALMDAVFAAAKGVVFGPAQTATKTLIGVVTEVIPSRQAELAEALERVRFEANNVKARKLAEARGRKLVENARASGGDLRKAAKALGIEVKTSEPFTREGSVPGLGSVATVSEAFNSAPGTIIGPITTGTDQLVYKVVERVPADKAAFEAQKASLRESLQGNRQVEAFEIYTEDLKERLKKQGKVKIYQERVDRLAARQ